MRQLERREGEQRQGGGIPAEPLRVVEHRLRRTSRALDDPDGGVRDRTPRAEHAPHVAERRGEERQAEPEDDVDERRREVEELDRGAEERRQEREHEEPDRDRLQDGAEHARQEHRLEQPGKGLPARVPLEERPPPERAEQDERDDEDDRRRGVEERSGNREVSDAPDSVGEHPHGLTVSSAICACRSSSSITNRPGTVARKAIRARWPGPTSRMMSYPWRCTWSATSEVTKRTTRSPLSTELRTIPPCGAPPTTRTRMTVGRSGGGGGGCVVVVVVVVSVVGAVVVVWVVSPASSSPPHEARPRPARERDGRESGKAEPARAVHRVKGRARAVGKFTQRATIPSQTSGLRGRPRSGRKPTSCRRPASSSGSWR